MKTNCFVGDRRSPVSSALAVFECSNGWSKLQPTKIIPEGFYFIAGLLPHNLRKKADVVPNIFVQGYRPHSENGLFASEHFEEKGLDVIRFLWRTLGRGNGRRKAEKR